MIGLIRQLDQPSPKGLIDLGGTWDAAVLEECRRFSRLAPSGKAKVRREIDRDRSWAVVGWAESMATLAVRERDRDCLVYGLVGLSLFNGEAIDERDVLIVFPLFVRAGNKIGEDPDDIVRAAAGLTDDVGRSWLLHLLPTRDHESLMLHDERGAGDGFAFVRREAEWDPSIGLARFIDEEE